MGWPGGNFAARRPASKRPELALRYRAINASSGAQTISDAVDEATAAMNPLIRGIARSRLRKANPVIASIGFSLAGDPLIASYVGGRIIAAPANGQAIAWVDPFGDTIAVSHRVRGDRLVQSMSDDKGQRTNVYRFGADGATMTMTVEIRSEMLPEPVRYQLEYRQIP